MSYYRLSFRAACSIRSVFFFLNLANFIYLALGQSKLAFQSMLKKNPDTCRKVTNSRTKSIEKLKHNIYR